MYQSKRITALVTAAGSGLRMGGEVPKQFLDFQGEMILKKTLKAFSENGYIDEIYLICRKEDMDFCAEKFGAGPVFPKLRAIVSGGKERQDSVFNGLKVIRAQGKTDYVLIHDGVRPFVSQEEIDDLIKRVYLVNAASLGVAPKDSPARVKDGLITENLDRNSFYLLHTPQAFRLDLIYGAHAKAREEGFTGTDDTVLARRAGFDVSLVLGRYENIKITTRDDLFEEGRQKRGRVRVGHGFDVHSLVTGRQLILGGREIPYEKGLLGHSDADVLTHAVMDAILGGAGLGDIGVHFPDNSEEYRGISSIKLLEKTKDLVEREGYEVVSVDGVVVAQKPKISPYYPEIRENIAKALNIAVDQVNVKGTTTEKLGFIGRGEGMAALALATLYKK